MSRTSTIPAPPPRVRYEVSAPDGESWLVEVEHDCVSSSGLPALRTLPWSWAVEWLSAQGYSYREVLPTLRSGAWP